MPFGQTINAGLMNPDYSAIERAGQATGMGYQAIGEGIGNALKAFGDFKKEQKTKQKTIDQSELYIDAAIKLFPDMAPALVRAKTEIQDLNVPLDKRYASAEAVQGLLNMSMEKMKFNNEIAERNMKYGVQAAELAQRADAERRKPPSIADINVPGGVQQTVWNPETRRYENVTGFVDNNTLPQGGLVPDLPQEQEDAINRAMGVLPKKPITGVKTIRGFSPNGEMIVEQPDGQTVQTDPDTVLKHISGQLQARGANPDQADEQAARFIEETVNMGTNKKAATPTGVGFKPDDSQEGSAMSMEQYLELQKTQKVEGYPLPDGRVFVKGIASPSTPLVSFNEGNKLPNPPEGMTYAIDTETGKPAMEKVNGYNVPRFVPIPGGPAEAKIQEQEQGKQAYTNVASKMAEAVVKLDQLGGITNPQKGVGANIAAYVKSTPLGQQVGKATGSEEQQYREQIETSLPVLLTSMMQSAGISATQLNSNAELKFYAQAAGNTQMGAVANLKALLLLEQKYGKGDKTIQNIIKKSPALEKQVNAVVLEAPIVEGNGNQSRIDAEKRSIVDKWLNTQPTSPSE